MPENTPIHSVVTTLSIIELMAYAQGPMGVSEIAKSLVSTKPRIYRHLRTLLDNGYVGQDPETEKYYLSVKLFHIGQAIADQTDFLSEARRVMQSLRDQVNLSVTIGQFEENGVRVLDILKHRSEFEISARPGAFFDYHCSAQGKLALAFGPAHIWAKLEASPLKAWTKKTITDMNTLRREVKLVRRRGWALAPEEVLSGINALSAPIFGSSGSLVGSITILGSVQHLQRKPDAGQIAAVVNAAREVSSRLGFQEAIAV